MDKPYMLFSADGEYLRKIDVLEDQITEKINALSELELTYIGEDPSYGERILVKEPDTNKWHEFVVRELNAKRSKSLIRKLYAVSSFCETEGDYLDEKRVRDGSAFNALSSMLSSTRWKPGTVSVQSGNKNISFYHTNPLKGLKELCETYQCEFQERVVVSDAGVVDRFLDLKTTIGEENAKRFEYSKDLQEVERVYEPNMVYTAMYGYGKGIPKTGEDGETTGGFERKIDFSEINGGLKYVADEEARKVFGRPDGKGGRLHTFGQYENSQCDDKQQLLQETKDALKAQIQPKVSYKAKVIDLENYGFQFEGVGLGNAVTVIDKTFEPELRIRARVHSRKFSLYNNELTELELGSYTNVLKNALAASEHLAATIRAKENIWNRAGFFNENGTLSATYIEGLLEQITEEFKLGNNNVQTSVERGITIFNNKDESKATWGIQLSSRGLLIASSKRSNGEWNWSTALTGEGLTANVINAGVLKGANGHWNLDTGDIRLNNLQGSNADLSGTLTSGTYPQIKIEHGQINGYKNSSKIGTIDFDTWAFDNNGYTGYKDGLKIEAPAIFLNTNALFYAGKDSAYESNKMMDGYILFVDGIKTRVVQDGDGAWYTAVAIHYSNIIVYGGLIKTIESKGWEGDLRAL